MDFNIIEFIVSIFDLTVYEYVREVFGSEPWVEPVLDIIGIVVMSTILLLSIFFIGWVERKVLARMQDRIGPNRVGGRYGLLQMVADVVKMMTKEVIIPSGADKVAYLLAPIIAMLTSLLLFAVVPFAPGVIGVDLPSGVFYALAISSISVVALLLAGWGSNNKYALLGAFRAVAQLVSYEVPLILALLVPVLLARTLSTVGIVEAQSIPYILFVPVSALIFFISALAETGRSPFDLLEAESEIVAGFHTEYTGMYFGLFMAAEYIAIMFMCFIFSTVYLGGYRFFGLETLVWENIALGPITISSFAVGNIIAINALFLKAAAVFFVFMWLRATLPRFRIDQLLDFNWKFMVPLSLVLLFAVAITDKVAQNYELAEYGRMSAHLLVNIVLAWATIEVLRWRARRQREQVEGPPDDRWHAEPMLTEASEDAHLAHAD